MKLRDILAAASIVAMPLTATAQPVTGLYIGGDAGVNIMQEEHSTRSTSLGSSGADLKTRVGPAVSAIFGYGFGNGLRAEIEGDYRYNTFDGASFGNAAGGQEQKYGPMVNLLYDFVGLVPIVRPYVGVGAGYQWVKVSNGYVTNALNTARINSGTDGAFAYQAIIGAAVPIVDVPGLALTADYRFMGLAGTDLQWYGDYRHGNGAGFIQARRRLQPRLSCWLPLCIRCGTDGRSDGANLHLRSPGFALVSGVLRLGQGCPHRSCAPDRL